MAFYNGGLTPGESYFGDFAGGYRQTPVGIFIPASTNALGLNSFIPGANLPSLNPNNYPGIVHFGPSTAVEIVEPMPIGTGYGNSNLHLIEGPLFTPGY